MNNNNKGEKETLEVIVKLYNKAIFDIEEFLENNKTYKDMTVEEFQRESKLLWERMELWQRASEYAIKSNEKLNEDFQKIRLVSKRLLL